MIGTCDRDGYMRGKVRIQVQSAQKMLLTSVLHMHLYEFLFLTTGLGSINSPKHFLMVFDWQMQRPLFLASKPF